MQQPSEVSISEPINVPVPHNRHVRHKASRRSRSLEHNKPVKQLFYDEHIGSETRTREFKEGGGDYEKRFGDDLRKYGCGFLNSGGGELMVGVDDHGSVRGFNINFKLRDELRQKADVIFKKFNPSVQPKNYTLEFVPVVKKDEDGKDLMVLCLSLNPPTVLRKLYQTDTGKVFRRRDGSVEIMNIHDIQKWSEQNWNDEVEQLNIEKKQLTKENKQLTKEVLRLTKDGEQKSIQIERLRRKQTMPRMMPGDKRRKIQSGGGENSTVWRPQHEDSDDREIMSSQEEMNLD